MRAFLVQGKPSPQPSPRGRGRRPGDASRRVVPRARPSSLRVTRVVVFERTGGSRKLQKGDPNEDERIAHGLRESRGRGRPRSIRAPRGSHHAALRCASAVPIQARPGSSRARRSPHGRRLWPRERRRRCLHGDVRPGRHQSGDRPRQRNDGFGARGRDHGERGDGVDRFRCLPGSGHYWHHDPGHEAQLPRARPPAAARDDQRGVSPGPHRATGTGARRHPEGRAAERGRVRVPEQALDARLQPDHSTERCPGPQGSPPDRGSEPARNYRWPRRAHRRSVG